MKALLLGLVFLLAAVLAIIPAGLGWWADVLAFLRGAAPVIAVLIGLVAVFIGIADIKDRAEAKKEDAPGKSEE
jgi:type IV secretory pathway VirB2 component (pilin)